MKGNKLLKTWKDSFKEKNFTTQFIVTFLLFALITSIFTRFLTYNESRVGFTINDPILNFHSSTDLTYFIFFLIYLTVLSGLFLLIKSPKQFTIAFQIYTAVLLLRFCFMFLLPLDPPVGIIPLHDPFIELFGTGETLLRDLFFSGHTATLFLFFLIIEKRLYKLFFLISTVLVAFALLLQHVHYTIDILTAPFVVYGCYRFVYLINKK